MEKFIIELGISSDDEDVKKILKKAIEEKLFTIKKLLAELLMVRANKIGRIELQDNQSIVSVYVKNYKENRFSTVLAGFRYLRLNQVAAYISAKRLSFIVKQLKIK